MYLSLRDNCYGLIITASYWAFLSWRWMPHWTSLQLHSAPTAAISPKVLRLCGRRSLEFVFSRDASIFAYQSPNPLEEELRGAGGGGEGVKNPSLPNWDCRTISTEWAPSTPTDVLFIAINAFTVKGPNRVFQGSWSTGVCRHKDS